MSRRDLTLIFVIALAARIAVAAFQAHPGYMDAYYYAVGADRLAGGHGFTEPYVWNYLDDPTSLPHPSHLYWMPLPSLLGALSMSILGSTYRALQAPFVLLSALIPLIAYAIAWRATARRRPAWIAALLATFSGFYLPFWGVPESFAPYAVFGSVALLLSGTGTSRRAMILTGACAGLAHLTRADGILLLAPLLPKRFSLPNNDNRRRAPISRLQSSVLVLLGYLIVMSPWFARNVGVVGAPISPAGMQTLWLCNYDELFSFGVRLDVSHWLGCGLGHLAAAKLRGLGSGLVHLIAENGLVYLAPLMLVGLWRMRRERLFGAAIGYLVLLYLAMTLAFTFVGERGGLFHSGAALAPFLYAAAPIGLEAAVDAVARRRQRWNAGAANRVFGAGVVALAALFSVTIVVGRVIVPGWNRADWAYRQAGDWLAGQGDRVSIVVAGNPPGLTYHTGHPSIVTPNGNVDVLLAAADRFGARWIVLDANRPAGLAEVYADPESCPRLTLAARFGDTYLLEVAER